ncbi:response regulator receiver domain protein [Bacteriovorax sp. BSW11_IV]|uniref:response regulator transcription factor n=1 Tax=Bacteriovorax sp. BSW11_IV TaxID=1353529 RepID=UPI00038A146A|nr:response regulator transcription factor [Bacteriovorax sp. BSW11_IV]EQC49585.1 response regulator receiver domain protein [Bacteriovorax sp. BSW11_IV]
MQQFRKEDGYHVTIVDDVYNNLMSYKELLENEFDLELIQNPLELLGFLNTSKTDLVLLDLHMPNVNGFELYNKFKDTHPNLPVIFLTGDPSEEAVVEGLNLGAEDFIVKPVSLKELVARVRNKINSKKGKKKDTAVIKYPEFSLHTEVQMAEIGEKKVQLTPIEFKIIHLLARNPNKIFSREYITNLVWPNVHVQNQNIDTHLSNLRKKLKPFSQYIKTIKSRGYILRI